MTFFGVLSIATTLAGIVFICLGEIDGGEFLILLGAIFGVRADLRAS